MDIEKAKAVRLAWEKKIEGDIRQAVSELQAAGLKVVDFSVEHIGHLNGEQQVVGFRLHVEV